MEEAPYLSGHCDDPVRDWIEKVDFEVTKCAIKKW